MNKVILLGRIGKDPELKTFSSGAKVLNFSMATSKKLKDKSGEWQEETQWHRCQVWGDRAGNMTYLGKGDKVVCEGEIKYSSYDTPDGQTKYVTDVVCHHVSRVQKNEKAVGQTYDPGAQYQQAEDANKPFAEKESGVPF